MSLDAQIVVAGGGLTGGSAALGLARAGFQVILVDAGSAPALLHDEPYRLRVSTLSPASMATLTNLGVWSSELEHRAQRFNRMVVWENDSANALTFSAGDANLPDLGAVVENEQAVAALWASLSAHPNVQIYGENRVTSFRANDRGVRLDLADGSRLRCELLVAADGANSAIRSQAGIEVDFHDYLESGLVATVALADGHRDTAWQRFLPTGPLAFLPLTGDQSSIVWTMPQSEAAHWKNAEASEFEAHINSKAAKTVGKIRLMGERATFPLRRLHAQRYIGERLVLIGDAAHVVHPLAGQGANLGLLDAAALIEMLQTAKAEGISPHAQGVLRRYERWRTSENAIFADALHLLHQFYASPNQALSSTRSFGTNLLNNVTAARAFLIEHASGLQGRVPALAQHRY